MHIAAPVTVVGDIHGQFFDMLEIFKIGGFCPNTNYLFLGKSAFPTPEEVATNTLLGDYVDRGLFSVETISLLVCLKLRYPNRVHLIRGNHESRGVTQSYGFYTECSRKYGNPNVWHYFTDMFDFLTLIGRHQRPDLLRARWPKSPSIHSIDQIKDHRPLPRDSRTKDPWPTSSGPIQTPTATSSRSRPAAPATRSAPRSSKSFSAVNGMSHILRAHQLCQEGYQVLYDDRLSTVWSAPNYCYRCGNMASVLEVSDTGERFFNVFDAAPENEVHRQQQQQDLNVVKTEYFL